MVPGVRRQQLPDALKLILTDLDRLVMAFQAGIQFLGNEQVFCLRQMRAMAIHAGAFFRYGRMLDLRGLLLVNGFLVAPGA